VRVTLFTQGKFAMAKSKQQRKDLSNADDWFDSLSGDNEQILRELRKLVLSLHNNFLEEIKWNQPCYKLNRHVCYLNKAKSHSVLGFQQGTHLPDPQRLLEGTGKDMRHIKVGSANDINKPAFKALIKYAIKIDQAKK
jgi:hypothetical protein